MKAAMLRTAGVVMIVLTGFGGAGCHKTDAAKAGPKAGASSGGTTMASEIMKKVNRRQSGLHSEVGAALQTETIDWAAVQPKAQEYATLANSLGACEPAKGDKTSWETLTKAYANNAHALFAAVEKKDKDTALDVHGQLSRSCMACHRAHRQ